MNIELYKDIVKRYCAKKDKVKNGIIAFLSGGLIGVIGEGLIELYINIFNLTRDVASPIMIVTLIFISCLFTGLGFMDKLVNVFKCGLIIPITGFAHSVMSSALDYKNDGMIFGLGSNIFKLAGSVILYGVVSAWFFGMIRYLFLGGI